MADTEAAPAVSPKKKTTARKPAKPSTHPPVAQMVNAAIKNLKDRKGSSLAAIKKYIAANYKCDVAKLAPFIRKYLKKAVADGKLKQVKGSGAAGSFKLADKAEKPEKKKPKKVKKTPTKKKAAKKSPKKAAKKAAPKKAKTPKKKATPKKAATKAKKPAKKPAKSPAKPKKAAASKAKKPAAAKKSKK